MRNSRTDSQFAAGFFSAIILLVAVFVVARVGSWLYERRHPETITELATEPVISIADIFAVLAIIAVAWLILMTILKGPNIVHGGRGR